MLADSRPRFLFDVMLARLCRYARAAGYDAELAQAGEADRDLIARALSEARWLVSPDRRMAEHKAAADCLVLLEHGNVETHALALRFHLDWLVHAFTRCLLDNTVLIPADAAQTARLPPDGRAHAGPVLRCPRCGRLYWEGSHVRRMRAKLAQWQAAQPSIS